MIDFNEKVHIDRAADETLDGILSKRYDTFDQYAEVSKITDLEVAKVVIKRMLDLFHEKKGSAKAISRDTIKKEIRNIENSYDYHSYNGRYDINVDLDNLTDLIATLINGSSDVSNSNISENDGDICEWFHYDYRTIAPTCHGDVENPYWRIPKNLDNLKFCPYCGKLIRIKED